jgi:hypothetical protein
MAPLQQRHEKVFGLHKGAHGKEMVTGFGRVFGKKAILERLSEFIGGPCCGLCELCER